jgi:hypothetical protein
LRILPHTSAAACGGTYCGRWCDPNYLVGFYCKLFWFGWASEYDHYASPGSLCGWGSFGCVEFAGSWSGDKCCGS